MFGEVAQTGMSKPFMMMTSERLTPSADMLAAAGMTQAQFEQVMADYDAGITIVTQSAHPGYLFLLRNSMHNTYTTDYLSVAKAYPDLVTADDDLGTIDGDQAFDLIRTYVLAFFDQEVKGEASDLLANSASDTQITLETFNIQ